MRGVAGPSEHRHSTKPPHDGQPSRGTGRAAGGQEQPGNYKPGLHQVEVGRSIPRRARLLAICRAGGFLCGQMGGARREHRRGLAGHWTVHFPITRGVFVRCEIGLPGARDRCRLHGWGEGVRWRGPSVQSNSELWSGRCPPVVIERPWVPTILKAQATRSEGPFESCW